MKRLSVMLVRDTDIDTDCLWCFIWCFMSRASEEEGEGMGMKTELKSLTILEDTCEREGK